MRYVIVMMEYIPYLGDYYNLAKITMIGMICNQMQKEVKLFNSQAADASPDIGLKIQIDIRRN